MCCAPAIVFFSGLVCTLSQTIMSMMVLLCWVQKDDLTTIYAMKFVEMASINVWSISSLAIALLIANIVKVRPALFSNFV